MDTNAQQINSDGRVSPVIWHYETMPRRTKKALMFLSEEKWLKESGWYLAGGTALALATGNRKSLDLDFFTQDKNFDANWKKVKKFFIKEIPIIADKVIR